LPHYCVKGVHCRLGRWRQLTKNAKGQVEAVIISRSTREASQPLSLAETKLQYQFAMAARPTGLGRGQKFIKQEPLTALAEQCELAIRQVPRYSRRSDGRFPESSSGCSWPKAEVLAKQGNVRFGRITAVSPAPTFSIGQYDRCGRGAYLAYRQPRQRFLAEPALLPRGKPAASASAHACGTLSRSRQRHCPLLSLAISASTRAWSASSASLADSTTSGGRWRVPPIE